MERQKCCSTYFYYKLGFFKVKHNGAILLFTVKPLYCGFYAFHQPKDSDYVCGSCSTPLITGCHNSHKHNQSPLTSSLHD